MSKQVITIGYLKDFVSGILDVSIAYDNDETKKFIMLNGIGRSCGCGFGFIN